MTPDHEAKLRSGRENFSFLPLQKNGWYICHKVFSNLQPIAKQNKIKVVHIQHHFFFSFFGSDFGGEEVFSISNGRLMKGDGLRSNGL